MTTQATTPTCALIHNKSDWRYSYYCIDIYDYQTIIQLKYKPIWVYFLFFVLKAKFQYVAKHGMGTYKNSREDANASNMTLTVSYGYLTEDL